MTRTILALIAVCGLATAMTPADDSYKKVYYKDTKIETNEATIEIVDAVATEKETKFKIKVINKTDDYLVYKPEESAFILDGKEMKPKEKMLFIQPNGSASRVINITGTYTSIRKYAYYVAGLYKASAKGEVVSAPDFKLPPSQNEFAAGSFNCSLVKLKKESDETTVKFKCRYNGNKIGIFNPKKAAVTMPTGSEYANARLKSEALILMKGAEDDFVLEWSRMPGGKAEDMQKVEMLIKWKDAFSETTLQPLGSHKADLEFDEALTKEKNK
jgi:hypothetical protein